MRKGFEVKKTKQSHGEASYHHGNLREALLTAAIDIIEKEGVEALNLRRIASAVGVSRTAPYRHFDDKEALLTAVATQGFIELAEVQEAVVDKYDRLGKRGVLMSEVYIRFAVENPELYRLMFGPIITNRASDPELAEARERAFKPCDEQARLVAAEKGVDTVDAQVPGLATWASVHGVASLVIDQAVALPARTPEEKIAFGQKMMRYLA